MSYISDLYPLKAQYRKNELVKICMEFLNPLERSVKLAAEIRIMNLTKVVEVIKIVFSLEPGRPNALTVEVPAQDTDFGGFGFDLDLYENAVIIETASTAFDVVSNWKKAMRYGFLCGFGPDEEPGDGDTKSLLKFHLNLVQFYDWTYRHHDFLPPEPQFRDLMGKQGDFKVILRKIAQCHEYGMKAIAYGPVYAADSSFFDSHKDWALYNSSGEAYKFIDTFYIMNISPDSPWHDHIIGQYKRAVAQAGFDGIHMDTYGFPKSGFSRLGGHEKAERLEEHLPVLINDTRQELEKTRDDVCLIFNNVCNWPVDAVAKAQQDAVYIEVWDPYERYFHIQQLIGHALELGGGKPVILAAYLLPFRENPASKEAENAALLLTAVIAACGGHHLLLGETNGVLTQGYYVDHSTMEDSFVHVMRLYYDFIVRFTQLLFDKTLKDVSMTHIDGDNMEYAFENVDYSTYEEPGRVCIIAKESPERKIIHLINLIGNNEDYWNTGKNDPVVQSGMIVKVQILSVPKCVYAASPDFELGRPQMLDFTVTDSDRGMIAAIKLLKLVYWNMVVMEF
jgi:dextranase